jgi:hypothetical protein
MKLGLISLISTSFLLLIWLLALPAWAAEYLLEVTDLDYMTYAANQGHLGDLEKRLDTQKFSTARRRNPRLTTTRFCRLRVHHVEARGCRSGTLHCGGYRLRF